MQNGNEPGRVVPAPTPVNEGRRVRRVASWVTAVAALVVIAVITTALLVSHAGKPAGTGGQGGSTVTPTTSSSNGWKTYPSMTDLAGQPMLAPSNPQIVYVLGPNPATLAQERGQRRSLAEYAHASDGIPGNGLLSDGKSGRCAEYLCAANL